MNNLPQVSAENRIMLSLRENEIKSLPFHKDLLINCTAAERVKKIMITAGLSPFNPEVAAIKASILMFEEIDECAKG